MTKEMKELELKELIETKREELNEVVNTGIVTDRVLEISMELDELIVKYIKGYSKYAMEIEEVF